MRNADLDDVKDRNYAEAVKVEWEELRKREAEIDAIMGTKSNQPVRIQRSREKGFDLQLASRAMNGLECVYVGRPTKFGNPFKANVMGAGPAITQFREWLKQHRMFMTPESAEQRDELLKGISELKGKNLACFCKISEPCHADVLLEMIGELG